MIPIILKSRILVIALAFSFSAYGQTDPIPKEGIATIIDLFNEKPVVAIGETHGHEQLYEFLTKLVQTEGFYTNVNDILIEWGNALYQDELDQYISGKEIEFEELKKVWFNTTQSPVDPWSTDVYYKLLTTIRNLNSQIPESERIRVIAADPPILWKNISTNEDYLNARGSRNDFYAQKVIDDVLSKNRKALLISGGAHFGYHNATTINQKVEAEYPNAVAVVLAKSGLFKGAEDKEQQLNWPAGTLVNVKDTWIGLLPGPRMMVMAPSANDNNASSTNTSGTSTLSAPSGPPSKFKRQDYFEYLLYLGPAEDISYGKIDVSIYQSDSVWNELNRRSQIRFNHKLIKSTRENGVLRPEAYN